MVSVVPSSGVLKEDHPLAPYVVAADLSSSVLGAATSQAPSQDEAPSLVSSATSSATVFPLALGVSGSGCGFVDSQSQMVASLVGVGRTSLKGNLVMPSSSLSGSYLPMLSSLVADIPVATSSLDSGISRFGSGVADLWWQKAASLVEDGWTVVK